MSKLDLSSPLGGKDLERREKNALVERTNLLNMLKLSIKALIESYMELRKQITDGHKELEQFFIIIEDILRHRIKTKRNILGAKREFLGNSFADCITANQSLTLYHSLRDLYHLFYVTEFRFNRCNINVLKDLQ